MLNSIYFWVCRERVLGYNLEETKSGMTQLGRRLPRLQMTLWCLDIKFQFTNQNAIENGLWLWCWPNCFSTLNFSTFLMFIKLDFVAMDLMEINAWVSGDLILCPSVCLSQKLCVSPSPPHMFLFHFLLSEMFILNVIRKIASLK